MKKTLLLIIFILGLFITSQNSYATEIKQKDLIALTNCGTNMHLNADGNCLCNAGFNVYIDSANNCFTSCSEFYGPHSIQDDFLGQFCVCETGYEWNDDITACISKNKIFSDISSNYKFAIAIQYLKLNEIINGYPDGTFKPENTVNRAELMKILIGDSLPNNRYENCFKDVKQEWFAPYICYAKERGWIEGYSDGTFKPAQTVNRAEAIKMAIEVFEIDLPSNISTNPYPDTVSSQWYTKYVLIAKEKGLFNNSMTSYYPANGMQRGDISDIIYRLLTIKKLQLERYNNNVDTQMFN